MLIRLCCVGEWERERQRDIDGETDRVRDWSYANPMTPLTYWLLTSLRWSGNDHPPLPPPSPFLSTTTSKHECRCLVGSFVEAREHDVEAQRRRKDDDGKLWLKIMMRPSFPPPRPASLLHWKLILQLWRLWWGWLLVLALSPNPPFWLLTLSFLECVDDVVWLFSSQIFKISSNAGLDKGFGWRERTSKMLIIV